MELDILHTYKSALRNLAPKRWLNDQCINFYYEYLEKEGGVGKEVRLIDPSSVALMLYTQDIDELFEIFDPLELDSAELICCPINDNTDKFQESGGNHWALLVYLKSDNKFHYYDSGSGVIPHVTKIASKLRCLIENNSDKKALQREMEEVVVMSNSPKQENSYGTISTYF